MKHSHLLPLVTSLACGACGTGVSSDPPDPRILEQASGCSMPQGPLVPDDQQTSDFLIGTWVRCSGPGLLGIDHEAGIELQSDNTFTVLVDQDGSFVAQTGFGNQGTWGYGAYDQFAWHNVDGGRGGQPTFETSPRRFALLVNYNEELSIYAIVDDTTD